MADYSKKEKRKNSNSDSSSTVIVSCAGDNELARSIYHFLLDKFSHIKTSLEDDEVYIKKHSDDNKSLLLTATNVKAALEEFLLNSPSSLLDQSKSEKLTINSLGEDVFVIAIQVDAEDIGLHRCSWCSMLMESEGELELHEKMHDIIGAGGGIGI